ncbi:MAG: type IX secretion system sortase PorU [Candidatus Marinimicrobia bacterium]|nr:type IX secretion system sortase PorU [Candidatus Neomarinimicrobiota bacterium]
MIKYLSLILISSSLFGMDLQILESGENSLTVSLILPEPKLSSFVLNEETIQLPRWSDAYLAYDSTLQNMVPFFSIPILIPPSGEFPEIEVIDSRSEQDHRISSKTVSMKQADSELEYPGIANDQWISTIAAEDFRAYKTARILIKPYAVSGQRLIELTFRIIFPKSTQNGSRQDQDLVNTYLNSKMGANWGQLSTPTLNRTASTLPAGRWYRFPIDEMGIRRINSASFGANVPDEDPQTWQVFAPYFEGKSLPWEISNTEPTPENLKRISMAGAGLEDGEFSGTDEIIFFAQALNGDFKGDNFTHLYGNQRYYWLCVPEQGAPDANFISLLSTSSEPFNNTVSSYEKRLYHETELYNQLHSGPFWIGEKLTGSNDQLSIIFAENYLDFDSEIKLNALFVVDYDAGNYQNLLNVQLNGISFNVSQNNGLYKQIKLSGTAGENMLRDGNNTLRLNYSSNSNASIIYLDSLRLSYHRLLAPSADYLFGSLELPGAVNRLLFQDLPTNFHLWDISDPTAVREWQLQNNEFRITGSGYREIIGFTDDQPESVVLESANNLGEPRLRIAGKQADYIIISPEIFMDQAERIRELREELVPVDERLSVEIVSIDDIYDEFSAGTQDPAAIKLFLHYAYFSWNSPRLRYVLFLGDTDYDYRNITGQSKMIIPTYQKDGTTDVSSYATDDRYTQLGSGEWDRLPDFAIGRLPAQTPDQLEIMVDKIISYELTPEPGIWRNTVTLVADDPLRPSSWVETEHIHDTEGLANILPKSIQVNKVYLTEYPEVQDPNSPYIKKPKAREAFLQKLYNGTVLVNYLGHGSPNVWAQEEVFTVSDLGLVNTGMRLPFWVAGTCDWAKYDDVNSSCVPEELMLMEGNGAVGILSTTRKTYAVFNEILLSDFFDFLFPDVNAGRSITVGDAVMLAKNVTTGSDPNNEKYILFSDPALRLATPTRKGQIESVSPSVFQAMGRVNYSGVVDTSLGPGAQAAVTVYDTPTPVTRSFYISANASTGHISYVLPGKRIFRGLISVTDQDFSGEFTLPKDIKYSGEGGILSVQYWDDTGLDGSIFIDTLKFEGSDSTALNDQGPEILFISDNMVLLNGDHFSANEPLEIEISDDQGINLTGVAGHGITLAIDEDWDNALDVTELFEYDLDHSDRGRLSAFLSEIPPGEHLISAKAWDSQNNPSNSSVRLEFFAANDFRVYDLFNFPNPMAEDTEITFMLSHSADIHYAIYTLAGRKIVNESIGYRSQGFNSFPWLGQDLFGNELANGVYILVVEADSDEFREPTQSLQKLVIAR